MITAENARVLSSRNLLQVAKEQLNEIEALIMKEVRYGNSNIVYRKQLYKQTLDELDRLGYKVKDFSNNEFVYEIKW